jgi:hypothetical protein
MPHLTAVVVIVESRSKVGQVPAMHDAFAPTPCLPSWTESHSNSRAKLDRTSVQSSALYTADGALSAAATVAAVASFAPAGNAQATMVGGNSKHAPSAEPALIGIECAPLFT